MSQPNSALAFLLLGNRLGGHKVAHTAVTRPLAGPGRQVTLPHKLGTAVQPGARENEKDDRRTCLQMPACFDLS